ncbi:MAG: histidine phosphatase family protein [Promethearchaeota archaeon]
MTDNLKVLNSVPWGKPALALLSHAKDLIADVPAIILVRHSERNDIQKVEDFGKLGLNPRGLQAAYEFGNNLPTDRTYHFFHSPVSRCRETAEKIREGIKDQGVEGVVVNPLKEMRSLARIYIINESYLKYMERDHSFFVYNWLAGHYPPWEINLSQNVTQRIGLELEKILQSVDPNAFIICASHDLQVTAMLFHWAGILLTEDYIQFLDGFIFQYFDGKLIFYYKNGKKEIYPPYWWKFE